MKNQVNSKLFYFIVLLPLIIGADLIDPTRPPDSILSPQSTSTSQSLELTATFIYPHYQLAIINGQSVMVGDPIGAFTVTHISPYTVELMGPQSNKEILQLVPEIKVKQKRD